MRNTCNIKNIFLWSRLPEIVDTIGQQITFVSDKRDQASSKIERTYETQNYAILQLYNSKQYDNLFFIGVFNRIIIFYFCNLKLSYTSKKKMY